MSAPEQPTLEQFAEECHSFLAARYPRKVRVKQAFTWGEGSDHIAIFEEPDPEAERQHVASVRAWRRELSEGGLDWITGPPEFGGRGLGSAYQRVFDLAARDYEVPGNAPLTVSLGMIAPTILHGLCCRSRPERDLDHSSHPSRHRSVAAG